MNFIPVAQPDLAGNEKTYLNLCLDSTKISSQGDFVERFETDFAAFCGARFGVATTSGTTALHLALAALDVGPGDEVLIPTLTFVAVANAVRYCGAVPVLIDSEPETFNLNPDLIEAKITPRTRAIVVVHLYGHPADTDRIGAIADRHGIAMIEDAAEAHGAEIRGRRVGGLGRCGIFSFYGNKIVTTGEGGMVVTNDANLARRLRLLRGQGQSPERRYWFTEIGFNYRMTNLAAAIGVAQIERIDEALAVRSRLAGWYDEELRPLHDQLVLPQTASWARHVYWMYTVLLREGGEERRDHVRTVLADMEIETRPVFYPIHVLPPHREEGGCYPVAVDLASRGLNLPTHAFVTRENVGRIGEALRRALA